MKADAYSPTMTSSVCVRTQAIKEKCVTCVSAYLIAIIRFHLKLITLVHALFFLIIEILSSCLSNSGL